jgi:CelD/BcsL family acetyltransferase involved in cellulose biosynthesis
VTGNPVATVVRPDLGPWADAWDRLVDAMPLPSPFLRSWWLGHVAVGEPVFVLAVDGRRLLGGIALQRSTRLGCEWLELLGDGPLEPDHLDLVASPADVGAVSRAVAGWLGRPGSRVVDLVGLVDDSWAVAALPRRTDVTIHQWAPYAPLPPDHATYLAGRSGQVRSTISRSGKRLAKAGIAARVRDADDVDVALEDLHRLHDARWGERSGFLTSFPAFSAAIRAGARAGEVRFTDLADVDGRVVAVELELCVAGRWSFYQAGRLDERELRGSGSVLKDAVIAAAIEAGATEFDLLRGDEPYKDQWATARRPLVRARVGFGPRGLVVSAAATANRLAQELRRARSRRVEVAGSADRI